MRDRLKAFVDDTLPDLLANFEGSHQPKEFDYDVALPKVKEHGDLSVNLAFQLSRKLKKNPMELAETCKTFLEKRLKSQKQSDWIQEIVVARPGFINFRFLPTAIVEQLHNIHKQDAHFGESNFGAKKKVLIEFVSANPTGPLTIAHGRQAAVGDALARILSSVGYQVHKEFYLNDAGRQVRLLGVSLKARYDQLFGMEASIPEEGYQGEYLVDVAYALKEKVRDRYLKGSDEEIQEEMTKFGTEAILKGIKSDLAAMRVTFDEYFSERSLWSKKLVDKALEQLQKSKLTFEADGALWFRSTDFGDDKDRVLKKQNGDYTYITPDIAYHQWKFKRGYEMLINLWGPDHHGYIARIKAGCQALKHESGQLKILIVQLTTLYRGGEPLKMSTRKGQFVTLKELMNEVGVDATRFFFLLRKVESHLDFDLELAKEKTDENPVFYVQYAHARIFSLIKYSEQQVKKNINLSLIQTDEELTLVKMMADFPEVLVQAAGLLEPYRMVDYLRELSATFHRFYAKCRVVSDDEALTAARLFLVDGTRIVLRNGLSVLGVSAPESM